MSKSNPTYKIPDPSQCTNGYYNNFTDTQIIPQALKAIETSLGNGKSIALLRIKPNPFHLSLHIRQTYKGMQECASFQKFKEQLTLKGISMEVEPRIHLPSSLGKRARQFRELESRKIRINFKWK